MVDGAIDGAMRLSHLRDMCIFCTKEADTLALDRLFGGHLEGLSLISEYSYILALFMVLMVRRSGSIDMVTC